MVCRALSRLVACYFQHVDVDESAMPALWAHFADPELAKARAAALAAHKPVTVLANLTNMLRAASWQERARFLTGLKRGMPPPVFAGVRERLGALVEPSVWLSVDEAA